MTSTRTSTEELFRRGGKPLLSLLSFCVMSYRMEPLFAYLVGEFRMCPTPDRALALYDVFCAPEAPAKLPTWELLPPRVMGLREEVERIRRLCDAARTPPTPAAEEEESPAGPSEPGAPKYLFDTLLAALHRYAGDPIGAVGRDFDPDLSPVENLPGGRMNPAQRHFVERVWQPHVRPRLVGAGFPRVATVG
jgi:hypothetical protein